MSFDFFLKSTALIYTNKKHEFSLSIPTRLRTTNMFINFSYFFFLLLIFCLSCLLKQIKIMKTSKFIYANSPSAADKLTLARWIFRYKKNAYAETRTVVIPKMIAKARAAPPPEPPDILLPLTMERLVFSNLGRMLSM